jgi:hypothetical protein
LGLPPDLVHLLAKLAFQAFTRFAAVAAKFLLGLFGFFFEGLQRALGDLLGAFQGRLGGLGGGLLRRRAVLGPNRRGGTRQDHRERPAREA